MLVAQISDPHVTVPGDSPGAGVDSFANLRRALAVVDALDPRPAGIVISGDLVEHGTRGEYRRLREALADAGLPVWLMTGNHDRRDMLLEVFPEIRAHRGPWGLQYAIDAGPLRLLLLDSLVEGTSGGFLDDARLAWLDARLSERPEHATMVFVHHPPVATGLVHIDSSMLANGDALGEVIGRHRQVMRVASGHIHRSLACEFGGTTLTVCPSTAHQFVLDLRDGGRIVPVAEEPALQLHRWNGERLFTYTVPLG